MTRPPAIQRRSALLAVAALTSCREQPRGIGAPASAESSVQAAIAGDATSDATADATSDPMPHGLACLAVHYGGAPERTSDGWALVLTDGRRIVWDDGKAKTFDETLEAPDLQDSLATRYTPGAIVPVTHADHDPGRVRVTALFEATYGRTREAVRSALMPWTFRGHTLLVHRRAEPAFRNVGARLDAAVTRDPTLAPFFEGMGGTFVWRPIAGTHRPSAHSFGISLDLNPARSHYWRNDPKAPWKNSVPQAIVDAFEAEGFAWGGRWFHYDTMHFEWRPELSDPACR